MLKLNCKAQNYAWGKVGQDSIVGRIHNKHSPDGDNEGKPFAELWMGDHVNGSSQVHIDSADPVVQSLIAGSEGLKQHEGNTIPLYDLTDASPERMMGKKYLEEFGTSRLQYLFKVLSVRTALSIQAHPNKPLA
jgi:mannose-6-phosphate isomerase